MLLHFWRDIIVVTVHAFPIVIAHQILAHIMKGFLERAIAVPGDPFCLQAAGRCCIIPKPNRLSAVM